MTTWKSEERAPYKVVEVIDRPFPVELSQFVHAQDPLKMVLVQVQNGEMDVEQAFIEIRNMMLAVEAECCGLDDSMIMLAAVEHRIKAIEYGRVFSENGDTDALGKMLTHERLEETFLTTHVARKMAKDV